jgi:hypothetical protein
VTGCSLSWSRGVRISYATGTAQAVLDYAQPGARLIFSCGWHITRDGQDVYPRPEKEEKFARWFTTDHPHH